jgi:hypothetical protein
MRIMITADRPTIPEEEVPGTSEAETNTALKNNATAPGQEPGALEAIRSQERQGAALRAQGTQLLKDYMVHGGTDKLNKAISLLRHSLKHYPSGHPQRSNSLNNLASSLCVLFE